MASVLSECEVCRKNMRKASYQTLKAWHDKNHVGKVGS